MHFLVVLLTFIDFFLVTLSQTPKRLPSGLVVVVILLCVFLPQVL